MTIEDNLKQRNLELVKAAWFTEMCQRRPIGLVFCIDIITKEKKVYLGTGAGDDPDLDTLYIAKFGAKIDAYEAASLMDFFKRED